MDLVQIKNWVTLGKTSVHENNAAHVNNDANAPSNAPIIGWDPKIISNEDCGNLITFLTSQLSRYGYIN